MNAIILKLITNLITLNNRCQYCYSLVGLPNLNKSKRLLLLQHYRTAVGWAARAFSP